MGTAEDSHELMCCRPMFRGNYRGCFSHAVCGTTLQACLIELATKLIPKACNGVGTTVFRHDGGTAMPLVHAGPLIKDLSFATAASGLVSTGIATAARTASAATEVENWASMMASQPANSIAAAATSAL